MNASLSDSCSSYLGLVPGEPPQAQEPRFGAFTGQVRPQSSVALIALLVPDVHPFEPNQIDLSQGPLRETSNPLDVAIEGDGFFMLQQPKGVQGTAAADRLLTRAGNLTRDTEGRLVLATSGVPLLGSDGQPIVLPDDLSKVRIDQRGAIYQGTDQVGQLAVVMPADIANLRKEGRDALRLLGGKVKDAPADTVVHQKYLEDSTVDAVATLAELVKVSRGIEFSTRMMQTHDQMTGKLIDTFGRFG